MLPTQPQDINLYQPPQSGLWLAVPILIVNSSGVLAIQSSLPEKRQPRSDKANSANPWRERWGVGVVPAGCTSVVRQISKPWHDLVFSIAEPFPVINNNHRILLCFQCLPASSSPGSFNLKRLALLLASSFHEAERLWGHKQTRWTARFLVGFCLYNLTLTLGKELYYREFIKWSRNRMSGPPRVKHQRLTGGLYSASGLLYGLRLSLLGSAFTRSQKIGAKDSQVHILAFRIFLLFHPPNNALKKWVLILFPLDT